MTEEQLIQNITKSNSQSSNYYKLVKTHAYYDMVKYNSFVKYTNECIKELRETGETTGHYRIYNSKGKLVFFTKFTKYLRYRTYRQQLAITANTLENTLRKQLKDIDLSKQIFNIDLRIAKERQQRDEFTRKLLHRMIEPELSEDIDDYEIDELY